MKTRLLYFPTFLFLLLLGTCSCQKEENEQDEKTNHFKYQGKSYELNKGVIEYYGQWGGEGYNFDVTLFSNGISYSGMDITGCGHFVYMELYSNSPSALSPGSYLYDIEYEEIPFSWTSSIFGISVSIESENGTFLFVTSGTVKVNRDGSKYIFEMDLKTIDGKDITGYFKGELTFYDWSWKKSAKRGRFN